MKRNLKKHETVSSFEYLGASISDEGSKSEFPARIAQSAAAALVTLRCIWQGENISQTSKFKLICTPISIYLYTCESWTLSANLERRIETLQIRCFSKTLKISYRDHITKEEIKKRITVPLGSHDSRCSIVNKI